MGWHRRDADATWRRFPTVGQLNPSRHSEAGEFRHVEWLIGGTPTLRTPPGTAAILAAEVNRRTNGRRSAGRRHYGIRRFTMEILIFSLILINWRGVCETACGGSYRWSSWLWSWMNLRWLRRRLRSLPSGRGVR